MSSVLGRSIIQAGLADPFALMEVVEHRRRGRLNRREGWMLIKRSRQLIVLERASRPTDDLYDEAPPIGIVRNVQPNPLDQLGT